MKKVYELVFMTENGFECNLIFSSRKKAEKDLKTTYAIGASHSKGKITNAFVVKRTLF